MALSLWKATGNVLTYFHHMSVLKETYVATEDGLDKFDEKFGIQEELATHICKHMFSNHIARLTLEFPHPDVMEIVKDVKVTFPDMVGTIGKLLHTFMFKLLTVNIAWLEINQITLNEFTTQFVFRRKHRALLWTECTQHLRNHLLDLQDTHPICLQLNIYAIYVI